MVNILSQFLSQKESLPLGLGLQIGQDIVKEATGKAVERRDSHLELAPPPVQEWVGRKELLSSLNYIWLDRKTYVVSLIGFGGEGKSSLARRWLDDLWQDDYLDKPRGVLWWDFYKKRSVDEFFRAAIDYLSGGTVDFTTLPSADAQAKFLGGMLRAHRYLLILDGLEQAQHSRGDSYGFLKSTDLSEFLQYFAAGNHQSFCLITSRISVMDLTSYVTYHQLNVDRLSNLDGKELLKQLSVKGSEEQFNELVDGWNGHALTLNLLGKYLVEFYQGDIAVAERIPPLNQLTKPYERLNQLLKQYDAMLEEKQREFMLKFSVFRYPISQLDIKDLSNISWDQINKLVEYRILQFNDLGTLYTTHPLIRKYYQEVLKEDREKFVKYNEQAAECYLAKVKEIKSESPTLDELVPLVEAIRHLCRAGHYEQADLVRGEPILHYKDLTITKQLGKLGAYETELELLREFFIDRNLISLEPQLTSLKEQLSILYEVIQCLRNLGRIGEAIPFSQKYIEIALQLGDDKFVSQGYRQIAKAYAYLGKLKGSEEEADTALKYAEEVDDIPGKRKSLIYKGLVSFLRNQAGTEELFERSIVLAQKANPDVKYLKGNAGAIHADYLRRSGNIKGAREIVEANLAEDQKSDNLSGLYRALGDLEAIAGRHDRAEDNYREALEIARSITHWPALIKILSARGYWFAYYAYYRKDVDAAFNDLNEALEYATTGGYRIDEADIRVGLAWAYLHSGQPTEAYKQAKWAKKMSEEMDYYWGIQDAEVILENVRSHFNTVSSP